MRGKRKIWCAMAGGLLLAICACGKGTEGEKAGNEAGRGQGEQEYAYTAEYQSLDEYCESVSAVMLGNDQKIYFTGVKDNRNTLFVLDIDGDGVKEYPLELE